MPTLAALRQEPKSGDCGYFSGDVATISPLTDLHPFTISGYNCLFAKTLWIP